MKTKKSTQTIDLTPSWVSLVLPMLAVVENAKDAKNRHYIKQEFVKMAKLADKYVQLTKNTKQS